ncbi:galectin-3-binding protein A-like [Anguilla anguilla]|uniref:galectin-3-binding protein A-like n=1 Tax=Anguilla anguilla TaxID=7936 RepID=UPI0015A7E564|nr:galectin-3-binding protein A-like [Anguilla anguilla]
MLTLGIASLSWLMMMSVRLSAAAREGDLRLVGGRRSSEGRVEVYHGGQWGTVCDDGWDMTEAQVVCRQLRFPGAQSAVTGGTYGPGSGQIWLDDLDCKGTEPSLSSCPFKGWGTTDCTHAEDAGVICEKKVAVKDDRLFPLDHSLSLSGELGALFDSKRDCDLTVVVLSPEEEVGENTSCVHSLVLSLSTEPSFSLQALQAGNLTINVSQDCRSYVSQFLRYLYTREIDISASSAQCLHKLASDFGMKRLQEDAGRLFGLLLPWDSTFHTQASLYKYSVQTGDLALQETCLQYLAWNCEALVSSPAWPTLSRDALEALLSRSDLAVPDEAFLLRALESWVRDGRGSPGLGDEAALLRLIRFPMIPPAELYDLPFTSDLYGRHGELVRSGMLRGFQFHALSLAQLRKRLNDSDDEYLPRIYTANPWSLDVNSTAVSRGSRQERRYNSRNPYGGYNYESYETVYYSIDHTFSTPVHTSAVLRDKKVSWAANVFKTQEECSSSTVQCETVPAVRLRSQSSLSDYQSSIRFTNRLLVTCGNSSGGEGGYVFHVRDFKDNLALIPTNNHTGQAYPCYEDSYIYRFVVRPEYI